MNLQIVPMVPDDLFRVAALERVCFPADPWSPETFLAALENPNTAVLLARGEDGAIWGYAVLSAILDDGYLDNIAVVPEARCRGVGEALLSAVIGFSRENLSVLMLEVRASNDPAIALYEKYGFAVVGRRKNYYDAPKEDAILMTLEFEDGITTAE